MQAQQKLQKKSLEGKNDDAAIRRDTDRIGRMTFAVTCSFDELR